MKTIHWNTGRRYTATGQRMTATLHADGVVTFWDHDRMIHGELPQGTPLTVNAVMDAYDHNRHASTSRAHADGMYRGGANAEYKGR